MRALNDNPDVPEAALRLGSNPDFKLLLEGWVRPSAEDLAESLDTASDEKEIFRAQGGKRELVTFLDELSKARAYLKGVNPDQTQGHLR